MTRHIGRPSESSMTRHIGRPSESSMTRHIRRVLGLAFGIFFAAFGASRLWSAVEIKAVRVEKGPHVDGFLNDDVWKLAVPFTGFQQARPRPASPPSERTEARILYDERNLYIGIFCFESDVSRISANSMAHDAYQEGESDDNVKILLDPFQDKRTAYIFIVNPRGARSEGLAFGEHSSLDWDGIWEAKARILKDGWSAEIQIPFKTISFNAGLVAWGINIERYIARRQETLRASGTDLDSHFFNPNEAAALSGISGIKQGTGVTIRPYGLTSMDRTPAAAPATGAKTDWQGTGGIDVYKNFTPNFVGAVSVNTDFAETEVDERRINLTRFPLYFPEKRTFFLEGSEYFNFGTSQGGGGYDSSFVPFFSRRIGLVEEEQIPVLFGAKLFGRLGQTNISVVDVSTRRFDDPESGLTLPGKNLMAARVYQNLWEESRVGFIFTTGNPTAREDSALPGSGTNTLAGLDFRYATSHLWKDKNFAFDAWAVYNWIQIHEPAQTRHEGFGFRLDYPNDLWDANMSYSYYGDALNPGLGFISRPGVQNYSVMAAFMPRPKKDGWVGKIVRQLFLESWADFYWDLTGRLETRSVSFSPAIQLESGDRIEGDIAVNYDVLPFDFAVAGGVVIPQGPYRYSNYRIGFESAQHRPYQIELNRHFGQFYSGHYTETEIGAALKYKGYATLGVQTNLVRGRLPQGNFNENVFEVKADLFFSPDLGLMNYVQYDDVSKQLGLQSRIRWQISPGNEIFFVYTQNWLRTWDPMSRYDFLTLGRRGVFKIQLSIRP